MPIAETKEQRRARRRRQVASCCRQVTAFTFSHVGLAAAVVAYSIVGGLMFQALESGEEEVLKRRAIDKRDRLIEEACISLASAAPSLNESELILIRDIIRAKFGELQTIVADAVKIDGWDGKDDVGNKTSQQWSYPGALLYAITVITTIGYGHVAPKTAWGRFLTILYALIGIPLTFLYLSNIGNFLADCFRLFYRRICVDMCCCDPCERLQQSRAAAAAAAAKQTVIQQPLKSTTFRNMTGYRNVTTNVLVNVVDVDAEQQREDSLSTENNKISCSVNLGRYPLPNTNRNMSETVKLIVESQASYHTQQPEDSESMDFFQKQSTFSIPKSMQGSTFGGQSATSSDGSICPVGARLNSISILRHTLRETDILDDRYSSPSGSIDMGRDCRDVCDKAEGRGRGGSDVHGDSMNDDGILDRLTMTPSVLDNLAFVKETDIVDARESTNGDADIFDRDTCRRPSPITTKTSLLLAESQSLEENCARQRVVLTLQAANSLCDKLTAARSANTNQWIGRDKCFANNTAEPSKNEGHGSFKIDSYFRPRLGYVIAEADEDCISAFDVGPQQRQNRYFWPKRVSTEMDNFAFETNTPTINIKSVDYQHRSDPVSDTDVFSALHDAKLTMHHLQMNKIDIAYAPTFNRSYRTFDTASNINSFDSDDVKNDTVSHSQDKISMEDCQSHHNDLTGSSHLSQCARNGDIHRAISEDNIYTDDIVQNEEQNAVTSSSSQRLHLTDKRRILHRMKLFRHLFGRRNVLDIHSKVPETADDDRMAMLSKENSCVVNVTPHQRPEVEKINDDDGEPRHTTHDTNVAKRPSGTCTVTSSTPSVISGLHARSRWATTIIALTARRWLSFGRKGLNSTNTAVTSSAATMECSMKNSLQDISAKGVSETSQSGDYGQHLIPMLPPSQRRHSTTHTFSPPQRRRKLSTTNTQDSISVTVTGRRRSDVRVNACDPNCGIRSCANKTGSASPSDIDPSLVGFKRPSRGSNVRRASAGRDRRKSNVSAVINAAIAKLPPTAVETLSSERLEYNQAATSHRHNSPAGSHAVMSSCVGAVVKSSLVGASWISAHVDSVAALRSGVDVIAEANSTAHGIGESMEEYDEGCDDELDVMEEEEEEEKADGRDKQSADCDRFDIDDDDDDRCDDDEKVTVPISLCLIIIAVYVFCGAVLFASWEDWDYLTGSYFCFVTLTTIGFGDFVPGTDADKWDSHGRLVLCALWLAFGLSLLAMCFNLMQEEVRDKCRWLGLKIGFIKEDERD